MRRALVAECRITLAALMLMTNDAASLVRILLDGAALPPQAGLRISTDPDHQSLSMRLAPTRGADDHVVVRDDARVFLSPTVAERLNRRTLCAEVTAVRSVFFLAREGGRRERTRSRRRAAWRDALIYGTSGLRSAPRTERSR
jgi:hypothetical protein